jgi:hypothetical protein
MGPRRGYDGCVSDDPDDRPTTFVGLRGPFDAASEIERLRRLTAVGVTIAPMAVVPARVEEDYYRWNQLRARVDALFAGVDPHDPDEDDLDDLAPVAATWVQGHALLDEVIDEFYAVLGELPERLTVRRPDAEGVAAGRGRPALLAVKRVWTAEWDPQRLVERAARGEGWLPVPRPVLVHAAEIAPDERLADVATDALGQPLLAWSDASGRLARLAVAHPRP